MTRDIQSPKKTPSLLDAYLSRIGYRGRRSPTPSTLWALHRQHVMAIPFENIDILLGKPILLDIATIASKLIVARRGGYCFEQNSLFRAVLEALGIRAVALGARAIWNVPEGARSPRTHMLLAADIGDQTYLVDVGYGRFTLPEPLLLELNRSQATSHGSYRITMTGSELQLEICLEEEWRPLYLFSLCEQLESDIEVANWYTSTHQKSIFRNKLIVARIAEECRYALLDNRLSIYRRGVLAERQVIGCSAALATALRECFMIDHPDVRFLAERRYIPE